MSPSTGRPVTPDADFRGVVGQISRIRERANLLIEYELARRSLRGIVPAHGPVLAFLFRQGRPVPIKQIVDGVGRVKSTVTGVLQTLERHGYISRSPNTSDSRSTLIELTPAGRALQSGFDAISARLLAATYGSMPQADRLRLVELLAVLERNLGEQCHNREAR